MQTGGKRRRRRRIIIITTTLIIIIIIIIIMWFGGGFNDYINCSSLLRIPVFWHFFLEILGFGYKVTCTTGQIFFKVLVGYCL
jgi:hypothetical protein